MQSVIRFLIDPVENPFFGLRMNPDSDANSINRDIYSVRKAPEATVPRVSRPNNCQKLCESPLRI